MQRCGWCGDKQIYIDYHDQEWGVPLYDDQMLFEFLVLEGAQAGLSWITILQKRENYRKALDNFDAAKVATYDEHKVEELLSNPGIVRNKLKVNAAITNAKLFLEIQKESGSFKDYIWQFVDGKPIQNRFKAREDVPATSERSDEMSRVLKKRGFKFVGSTICYAFMQATGMVNDHTTDCFRYKEVQDL